MFKMFLHVTSCYKRKEEKGRRGWPFGSPKREGKTGFSFSFFGIGRKTAVARERLVAKEWEEREKEKKIKFFVSSWLTVGLCKRGGYFVLKVGRKVAKRKGEKRVLKGGFV